MKSTGIMEGGKDGEKIPPGLPLRQAQDDSLYEREETSGNDGRMAKASRSVLSSQPKGSCRVDLGRKGAWGKRGKIVTVLMGNPKFGRLTTITFSTSSSAFLPFRPPVSFHLRHGPPREPDSR